MATKAQKNRDVRTQSAKLVTLRCVALRSPKPIVGLVAAVERKKQRSTIPPQPVASDKVRLGLLHQASTSPGIPKQLVFPAGKQQSYSTINTVDPMKDRLTILGNFAIRISTNFLPPVFRIHVWRCLHHSFSRRGEREMLRGAMLFEVRWKG